MYYVKKTILKCFGLCVLALSRASFAAALWIIAAEGLSQLDHLERYALLRDIVIIERFALRPAVAFLHVNAPTFYSGLDLAPYLIAAAIIFFWSACESERHRLKVMNWDLDAEHAATRAARVALRETMRLAAERA